MISRQLKITRKEKILLKDYAFIKGISTDNVIASLIEEDINISKEIELENDNTTLLFSISEKQDKKLKTIKQDLMKKNIKMDLNTIIRVLIKNKIGSKKYKLPESKNQIIMLSQVLTNQEKEKIIKYSKSQKLMINTVVKQLIDNPPEDLEFKDFEIADTRLAIDLTKKEIKKLEEDAELLNVSKNTYLRTLLNSIPDVDYEPEPFDKQVKIDLDVSTISKIETLAKENNMSKGSFIRQIVKDLPYKQDFTYIEGSVQKKLSINFSDSDIKKIDELKSTLNISINKLFKNMIYSYFS